MPRLVISLIHPKLWKVGRVGPRTLLGLVIATALAWPTMATTLDRDDAATPAPAAAVPDSVAAAMARALADRADAGMGNTFADSVALASFAAQLQLESLGVTGTAGLAPVAHATPSAALNAFLAAHGVVPTLAQTVEMAQLDLQPGPVAQALTRFVDAFAAHWLTTQLAYAGLDAMVRTAVANHVADAALDFADLGIDYPALFATRATYMDAAVDLRLALDAYGSSAAPMQVAPVFSFDFGVADNTYTQDFALLWDEAGDDLYLNNAGGSGNCADPCTLAATSGAAALVDGSGNDRYVANRGQGVNGGGWFGSGFLLDESGNDEYLVRDDGTNGAGMVGMGLLIDQVGDDSYTALGWGVNGGGYIGGIGSLLDRGGNDVYFGSDSAVNGGATTGRGLLYEESGNDNYRATSFGVNGGGWAGVGVLLDRNGLDTYVDNVGGAGTDMTVIPKELTGAQRDE